MSWQCKLLEVVGTRNIRLDPAENGGICGRTVFVTEDGQEIAFQDMLPGTMFYVPTDADMTQWPWYNTTPGHLSDYYHQHNAGRRPLFVVLPGKELFLIDGQCWKDGRRYGGWEVSGEPPNITVSPSINIGGIYHGWLQNGVISDECEGRRYDAAGYRIPT